MHKIIYEGLFYLRALFKLLDTNPIINDNSIILAIIAINMTVIGLTSLAESKTIIGIDYGKFLIKKYKFGDIVRIYYLLIGFAVINCTSLLLLFINNSLFKIINFMVLILSLVFAIYYFFGFILIENKWVKQQIYEMELLGLYCHSDDKDHFPIDKIVGMNSGTKTSRKISSNVIDYFNIFTGETQEVFDEVFGPKSIIYDESKSLAKKRKKLFKTERYRYRISNSGVHDISFEFFQTFRYSQLQDKWLLDILRLINGDPKSYPNYDIFRLYNLSRVMAQINVFGNAKSLFQYKFLEYLRIHIYAVTDATLIDNLFKKDNYKHIREVELYLMKELFEYIIHTCAFFQDKYFIDISKKTLRELFLEGKYKGLMSKQELLEILLDKVLESNSDCTKELYVELLNLYCEHPDNQSIDKIKVNKLTEKVNKYYQNNSKSNMLTVKNFFGVLENSH